MHSLGDHLLNKLVETPKGMEGTPAVILQTSCKKLICKQLVYMSIACHGRVELDAMRTIYLSILEWLHILALQTA
jgi:hypothetical protein